MLTVIRMGRDMHQGDVIRETRERQHRTQRALAEAAGLSRATVQRVEAGGTAAHETLLAIASVLGIDASDLQTAPGMASTSAPKTAPAVAGRWKHFVTVLTVLRGAGVLATLAAPLSLAAWSPVMVAVLRRSPASATTFGPTLAAALTLGIAICAALVASCVPKVRCRAAVAGAVMVAASLPVGLVWNHLHDAAVMMHGGTEPMRLFETFVYLVGLWAASLTPVALVGAAAWSVGPAPGAAASGRRVGVATSLAAGVVLTCCAADLWHVAEATMPKRVNPARLVAYVSGATTGLLCEDAVAREDLIACSVPTVMARVKRLADDYRASMDATSGAERERLVSQGETWSTRRCDDEGCLLRDLTHQTDVIERCFRPFHVLDPRSAQMGCWVHRHESCPWKDLEAAAALVHHPAVLDRLTQPFLARPMESHCALWADGVDPEWGGLDLVQDDVVAERPGLVFVSETTAGVSNARGGSTWGLLVDETHLPARPTTTISARDASTGDVVPLVAVLPKALPGSGYLRALCARAERGPEQLSGVTPGMPFAETGEVDRPPDAWYPTDDGDLMLAWSYLDPKREDDGNVIRTISTIVAGLRIPRSAFIDDVPEDRRPVFGPGDLNQGWAERQGTKGRDALTR